MTDLNDIFDEVSGKQWKNKIQFELSGAGYDTLLQKNNPEGIAVKPFYHQDEVAKDFPKEYFQSSHPFFTFYYKDKEQAMCTIHKLKQFNIQWVRMVLSRWDDSFLTVLPLLKEENMEVWIELRISDIIKVKKCIEFAENNKYIGLLLDPIQQLMYSGNWMFLSQKADEEVWTKNIQAAQPLFLKTTLFAESGANIIQQIAYTLAHFNEYLNRCKHIHFQNVVVEVGCGPHFYFERAKIRALTIMLKQLASYYGREINIKILKKLTIRHQSVFEEEKKQSAYLTEMIGNQLDNNSFFEINCYYPENKDVDAIFEWQMNHWYTLKKNNSEQSPLDGSYYITELSRQFAEKGLEIFKHVENGGGLIQQLFDGVIQRKTEASHIHEQNLYDESQPEYSDAFIKDYFDAHRFFYPKKNLRKTIIKPVLSRRLSEKLEHACFKRYKSQKDEKR